jgi:glycopeptide antibiotics resistance protein
MPSPYDPVLRGDPAGRTPRPRWLAPGPVPWGLLGWLYVLVLWLTWTPIRDRPPEILWLPRGLDWIEMLGNLLLFAPIGAVLASIRVRSAATDQRGTRQIVLFVAITAGIMAVAVEIGQLRVPGRTVSPFDVMRNAVGAAAAALLATRAFRSGITPRAVQRIVGALCFTGVLVFLTATAFAASRTIVLSGWTPRYAVLAGDEVGGGRAYHGIVSDPVICGGAVEEEICATPGASPEDRSDLVAAAISAQRVRLSAVVISRAPQVSLARIVTFSGGVLYRNATLYQEDRDLYLRLRTPQSGPNATDLVFVLPEAVRDTRLTRIDATYEPGRIELRAMDPERTVTGRFLMAIFSGWWILKPNRPARVEPGVLLLATLVAAAAFSLPLGLLATGWAGVPPLARLVAGATLPALLLLPLSGALAIGVSVEDLVSAAAFGLVGAMIGLWTREQVDLGS